MNAVLSFCPFLQYEFQSSLIVIFCFSLSRSWALRPFVSSFEALLERTQFFRLFFQTRFALQRLEASCTSFKLLQGRGSFFAPPHFIHFARGQYYQLIFQDVWRYIRSNQPAGGRGNVWLFNKHRDSARRWSIWWTWNK